MRALLGAALLLAACAPGRGAAIVNEAALPSPPPAADGLAGRVFAPRDSISGVAPAPPATPTPVPLSPEAAERGARLYGMKGCAACHGGDARGAVGPGLAGTALSFEAVLRQVRSPPHPRMPPFPPEHLSDAEVADIYAFLQSLAPPERGKAAFSLASPVRPSCASSRPQAPARARSLTPF